MDARAVGEARRGGRLGTPKHKGIDMLLAATAARINAASRTPQRRVRTVYIVMEPININQCDSQTEPRRQGPNWLHPIDTEKAKDQTTSKRESLSRRPCSDGCRRRRRRHRGREAAVVASTTSRRAVIERRTIVKNHPGATQESSIQIFEAVRLSMIIE